MSTTRRRCQLLPTIDGGAYWGWKKFMHIPWTVFGLIYYFGVFPFQVKSISLHKSVQLHCGGSECEVNSSRSGSHFNWLLGLLAVHSVIVTHFSCAFINLSFTQSNFFSGIISFFFFQSFWDFLISTSKLWGLITYEQVTTILEQTTKCNNGYIWEHKTPFVGGDFTRIEIWF